MCHPEIMKESFKAERRFKEPTLQALEKKCSVEQVRETQRVSYIIFGEFKNHLDEWSPICEPLKMVVKVCFYVSED